MKSIAVVALALACVLGLATAQYGFSSPQQSSGFGNGGFLYLIGLLVVLFALFGSGTFGSTNTFVYGNFSGPTGGK